MIYVTRTFSDGPDIGIKLSKEEFIGQLAIGNNWNSIRIGFLWNVGDNGGDTAIGSGFAVGVCSGTAHPFGDANTTNFVGVYSAAPWLWSANGSFPYMAWVGANIVRAATKIGGAVAPSGDFTDNVGFYCSTDAGNARRGLNFVDITKGSPNYTVNYWMGGADAGATWAHTDFTVADMKKGMTMNPPILHGLNFGTDGAINIAASEAAGPLDTIDIYINQLANPCTIWEVLVEKFS